MRSVTEMRDLANQAYAEHASGVVKDDSERNYLEGVEEALRWACGDGTSADVAALLDRMSQVVE